ncbi:MAG TPA: glycosyltransferase [Saprospiraceae bacterium]|nr:glycosyltransferase [Saprospiraceae bacterium]HNT19445.1 glycosyltransferase [Saprospiraceae bacterium]
MVSYNSARFIKDSIQSILNQSYVDFELIICDDNSTDNTWEIISEYNDTRILKIKNEVNIGENANRNNAISLSKGQWLIFIDADDILYDYGLEIFVRHVTNNEDCGMIIARPWDERIRYPFKIYPLQFYQFEYLDNSIIGRNFTKVLFKKSAIIETGCFDNMQIKMGDAYIQYKIGMLYPSIIIQDGLSWWRRRKGQASEKLIQNTDLFIIDSYKYLVPLLANKNNPLNNEQKEIALNNLYGSYSRFVLKLLITFKFSKVISLLKIHPIPIKYFKSILRPQKRDYFRNYSGENPLV